MKYVGSKSVLLADTLSRLVQPETANEIPGLDINITQVLKVEPTRRESLQEETKADPTLASLTELIITGWPDIAYKVFQIICSLFGASEMS